ARMIPTNGYLAVYLNSRWRDLSCASCSNVFFDRVVLEIAKGSLLEENHYYPHGLPVKALSSTAQGVKDNRRKYQSNEYIKDLGLNWMDFNARQYDPQIGRFLAVDPLADEEGQQVFSPYAAMGNAPESMVDPNGTMIAQASMKEWNRQRERIVARRDDIQSSIDDFNKRAAAKGWSAEKLRSKIDELVEKKDILDKALGEMDKMADLSNSQVYSLQTIQPTDDGGLHLDLSNNQIVISYAGTANFLHETVHAAQFEAGDIAFDKATGATVGHDIYDEVSAYKVQYAYSSSSVKGLSSTSSITSLASITSQWVQGITNAAGEKPYSIGGKNRVGLISININSTLNDLMKAYPSAISALQNLPAYYNLKLDPHVYHK
ncbi:RHS repeat-associated core domain-containing protein, partial [Taibaiella helva]|uniref:RHS repeat-associated core domain-containing protein n=1 Tax=Taibaiella helva TaxID=2301235 RepID=UPI002936E69E